MPGRLLDVQVEALVALATLQPEWTLSGGAALSGFHLRHRATKDLDLFFHGLTTLNRLVAEAEAALMGAGFDVEVLQRTPGFSRLRAARAGSVVLVDLVAESVANVFPVERRVLATVEIAIDSRAEILVNKLAALYSRSEIRDLVDVKALVEAGERLDEALPLVCRKDGGFSPPDLAWVLRSLPVAQLARADSYEAAPLVAFREQLVERLLR